MMELHIDIETFSSEDLKKSGMYRYCESPDFEILMVAFAYEDNPVQVIDLAAGELLPDHFLSALGDPSITKVAHNAAFERTSFRAYGIETKIEEWECTLIRAAYCGYPLSLDAASKAMGLGEAKDKEGKALINYFSKLCKPTKTNGNRCRNFWHHDKDKWEDFKNYCAQDVEVERAIGKFLKDHPLPKFERNLYVLDQEINDRGIRIDLDFVKAVQKINEERTKILFEDMQRLTGLDNPNSTQQLCGWLSETLGEEITSVAKAEVESILERTDDLVVKEVLELRLEAAKSSIKKYDAMERSVCMDGRSRGLFQFYGANRTARWAGRMIQLQNLPQIKMKDDQLRLAKEIFSKGDYGIASLMYDNISNIMSQLIRPSLISKEGSVFGVADFSAIEARVIAWLAREQWRLDVFNSHGKLYEASASMMYGVPIESITKTSPERQKGKVAELALAYQGSVGAMKQMGAEDMGLTESEMKSIVQKWRKKSPAIVKMWYDLQRASVECIKRRGPVTLKKYRGIVFDYDGKQMTIQLPSGKKLYYQDAEIMVNKFDQFSIKYKGMEKGQWVWVKTYGGKLAENIVQAISRDILADSMLRLKKAGFDLVIHVHDEAGAEVPTPWAKECIQKMYDIMGAPIPWAEGLPLNADGYLSEFYKKD